jgi:hypothetical protein
VEQPVEQALNELGDLVDTKEPQLVKWGLCREEPSSGNKVLQDADGTTLAYQSEIYLHALTTAVPINSLIKVFNEAGEEVLHGKVLRYKKYKHYAKVWV